MKILLQKINVISPGSLHHLKEKDLVIENGKISDVGEPGKLSSDNAMVISGKNNFVSPGWFDLHANFSEPGYEYKEDMESGCAAAAQGGFTGVLLMPSTHPPVSNRPSVEFLLRRAESAAVNIYIAGTVTQNQEGNDLAEMYDMFLAGVKVFTDDKCAIQDSGLLLRALQYANNFGGKIFSYAEDRSLTTGTQVNEGIHSTLLGLKGSPSLAEEIMINRNLLLAEYANAPIHFSTISSRKGVEAIRKAKAKGLHVTSDVSAYHLLYDDSSLQHFDPNYKLRPPLRSADDKEALIEGLSDGSIDCICSDHTPQNIENKKKEFELAAFGAAGIETAFAAARTATQGKLSLPELIAKFTLHPRRCAGLKSGLIDKDHPAELTIFNPDEKWKVEDIQIKSKSKNNPCIGQTLIGKPIAVISKGQFIKCA